MHFKILPPSSSGKAISIDERVELGAADGIYFCHEWFPKTFRVSSPEFHYEMMADLENMENQFVGWKVFRDGAKTTLLRAATAKRVSYGLSRTAVFTSAAQRHAERTVRWLKGQIERNSYWCQTFGLRKGSKWTDAEIEIINELLGVRVTCLAIGMTGQTRGINVDDYRPDFWIADDPCNEENTSSEDQRKKTDDLFFGAMQGSLAPLTENPHSKMGLAQTPLHKDDLIAKCERDPTWKTRTYGVFDEFGRSRWESRHPTEQLELQKKAFIGRGQLHIWKREKECLIVPSEGKAFKMDRVQFYDYKPTDLIVFIGLDPAREKHANPKKAHKAAIVKVGVNKEGVYLLDYYAQKGKNPEELWTEFYRMATQDFPRLSGVEGIAYQQVLAWYFRQKMRELNTYFVIREIEDRRRKADRIRQAHSGLIDAGRFFIRKVHTEYYEALDSYSDDQDIDLLDAGAMAITLSSPTLLQLATGPTDDEEDYTVLIDESSYPELPNYSGGHCP